MEGINEEKMVGGTKDLFLITGKSLKAFPHNCIGALTFVNKVKKVCKGTGVAISPDLVLTVAHNVYDRNYGRQFENFRFFLGADG
jgi:V8-like Glu-specific endopeptidase